MYTFYFLKGSSLFTKAIKYRYNIANNWLFSLTIIPFFSSISKKRLWWHIFTWLLFEKLSNILTRRTTLRLQLVNIINVENKLKQVYFYRDEEYFLTQPKKMLIDTAKQIAKVSAEFSAKAMEISRQCPDKRMKHVSETKFNIIVVFLSMQILNNTVK